MMKFTASLSALLFFAPALASAGPLEDGQAAYDRGNYREALSLWRPQAEHGDADAEKALGWLYATGHGVTQDYAEARRWYRKAADQGLAEAQFNLGVFYENGVGVTKDYTEALTWYRKAADQQDAEAADNLGWMYQYGWGTTLDYAEAYKWYSRSLAAADNAEERDVARQDRDALISRMTPAQRRTVKDAK